MSREHRYTTILRLGLPILVGQLGMIVVGFADNIMVGNYDTDALSAASFVNNVFNVVIFACIGFTYGLTPIIGAMYSRRDDNAIGGTLRTGVILNLLFAGALTLLMGWLYFNLDRLGQPQVLLPLIRPYYLIMLAGIIPVTLFNVFAQWSYACNNTAMPMWIILTGNLLNVAGNYALIYGHFGFAEMGLFGAGISTFAARVFCPLVIIAIFILSKRYRRYHDGFRHQALGQWRFGSLNRTSWPVALQMTFESGSFSIAAIMAGWLGKAELASFQIIVIVGSLGFCVYYSMASAVSVLVSNRAGQADAHGMRRIAFAGYHIMLVLAAVASLIFWLFGESLFSLFTFDKTVVVMTTSLIIPLILYQLGDATQITFANALRGTSNVMPMLWIAFVSYVIIGIPASYILAFVCDMGIYGIILSFSASLFPAGALFLTFFLKSTKWNQSPVSTK